MDTKDLKKETGDTFCENCDNKGYYYVYNAYDLTKEELYPCDCARGKVFAKSASAAPQAC